MKGKKNLTQTSILEQDDFSWNSKTSKLLHQDSVYLSLFDHSSRTNNNVAKRWQKLQFSIKSLFFSSRWWYGRKAGHKLSMRLGLILISSGLCKLKANIPWTMYCLCVGSFHLLIVDFSLQNSHWKAFVATLLLPKEYMWKHFNKIIFH